MSTRKKSIFSLSAKDGKSPKSTSQRLLDTFKSYKSLSKIKTDNDIFKISKYFDNLFKFLNKYCFIKGAFVIADDNEKLFDLLKYTDNKYQTDLTANKLESHIIYKDETEHLMEMNLESFPITINCNADPNCQRSRIFKSFKWYRFNDNGHKFIFVKPEREPTVTIAHAMNALNRYYLKTGKEEECLHHRREDCNIDGNCDHIGQPLPYRNFTQVIINDKPYDVEETYERKGDEAFIIEPVSEFIINLIDKNAIDDIMFRYNFENNNMTITSTFTGGKYKKYSKKKKTLLKKNKTIRRKRNISKKGLRKGKY
jgi:hypothetical protein